MAWTYGNATDYRDLLGRLIDFLTGHPDLVASGQNWTLMRLFAPIAQTLGSVANPQLAFDANGTTDVVSSDPFPQWVGVHTACRFEPQTYLVRASASNPGASPRDFALEWSDDGISWTAADTRTGMTWTAGERKDFIIAAPAGAHSYWRLRVDATAAGTLAMASFEFLLPADGLNGVINSSYTSGAPQAVFRAPGLAGAEEIYCGIRAFQDATAGWYFWDLQGFIGFNPANDFYVQPGAVGGWNVGMSLWNAPIPYWFVANGRRVVVVAKVSTVYEAAYLGFIKPYATPGQYPYPLLAGGSMTGQRGRNYSVTSPNHRHFVDPGEDGQNNANTACMLRGPSGAWLPFQNSYYSSAEYRYDGPRPVWPTNYGYLGNVREAPDGRYVLSPVVLTQNNSGTDHDLFGELDGCYWVSGFNNAAENLINVGGVDHLVVQNVYRTSVRDYWALRLE